MNGERRLAWDWHPGVVPANARLGEGAYLETSYSFHLFRGTRDDAVDIRRGAAAYLGTMFDVGPNGRVILGEFAMVHGARIICDELVVIGDYSLISWNVVIMDTHRLPRDTGRRRLELEAVSTRSGRNLLSLDTPSPVRIGRNVWIGFDVCLLPGVAIGEGSVIGARSVVIDTIPPYSVAAGNPARVLRRLDREEPRS
jgi:acetyltransferase-like isoleucine patch superfamily enzyme